MRRTTVLFLYWEKSRPVRERRVARIWVSPRATTEDCVAIGRVPAAWESDRIRSGIFATGSTWAA